MALRDTHRLFLGGGILVTFPREAWHGKNPPCNLRDERVFGRCNRRVILSDLPCNVISILCKITMEKGGYLCTGSRSVRLFCQWVIPATNSMQGNICKNTTSGLWMRATLDSENSDCYSLSLNPQLTQRASIPSKYQPT